MYSTVLYMLYRANETNNPIHPRHFPISRSSSPPAPAVTPYLHSTPNSLMCETTWRVEWCCCAEPVSSYSEGAISTGVGAISPCSDLLPIFIPNEYELIPHCLPWPSQPHHLILQVPHQLILPILQCNAPWSWGLWVFWGSSSR